MTDNLFAHLIPDNNSDDDFTGGGNTYQPSNSSANDLFAHLIPNNSAPVEYEEEGQNNEVGQFSLVDITPEQQGWGELGGWQNTADGGVSTEITITVKHPELNQGSPTVIPTMVAGQEDLDGLLSFNITDQHEEIAVNRAIQRQNDGMQWPSFDTLDEANAFAQERSDSKAPERDSPNSALTDYILKDEDTFMGRINRGLAERVSDIGGGLVRFVGQSADELGDWLEERVPLGVIDINSDGISWRPSTEEDIQQPSFLLPLARELEGADFGYKAGTSWEDVKNEPLANVLPWALETGLVSAPDMAAAIVALPAYIAARTGEIGQARTENKGNEDATFQDFIEVAPASVGGALLERFGASKVFGISTPVQSVAEIPKEVVKRGLTEGATESVQEPLEYAAETVGTNVAFEPAVAAERALAGFVSGKVTGMTLAPMTMPVEIAQGGSSSDGSGRNPDGSGTASGTPTPALSDPNAIAVTGDGTVIYKEGTAPDATGTTPDLPTSEAPDIAEVEVEINAQRAALDDDLAKILTTLEAEPTTSEPASTALLPQTPTIVEQPEEAEQLLPNINFEAPAPLGDQTIVSPEATDFSSALPPELAVNTELAPESIELAPESIELAPEQVATPVKKVPMSRSETAKKQALVDPTKDELLTAVAKLGGINRSEAEKHGVDPAHFQMRRAGIRVTFRAKDQGATMDEMRETLSQYGYIGPDSTESEFVDLVQRSLSGESIVSQDGVENKILNQEADLIEADAARNGGEVPQDQAPTADQNTPANQSITSALDEARTLGLPEGNIASILKDYPKESEAVLQLQMSMAGIELGDSSDTGNQAARVGGLRPERNVPQGRRVETLAGQHTDERTGQSDNGAQDGTDAVGVLHSAGVTPRNTIADGQAGSERGSDPIGQLRPNAEADISLDDFHPATEAETEAFLNGDDTPQAQYLTSQTERQRITKKVGDMPVKQRKAMFKNAGLAQTGSTEVQIERMISAREGAEAMAQFDNLGVFTDAVFRGQVSADDLFRWANAVKKGNTINSRGNITDNAKNLYTWAKANAALKIPERSKESQARSDAIASEVEQRHNSTEPQLTDREIYKSRYEKRQLAKKDDNGKTVPLDGLMPPSERSRIAAKLSAMPTKDFAKVLKKTGLLKTGSKENKIKRLIDAREGAEAMAQFESFEAFVEAVKDSPKWQETLTKTTISKSNLLRWANATKMKGDLFSAESVLRNADNLYGWATATGALKIPRVSEKSQYEGESALDSRVDFSKKATESYSYYSRLEDPSLTQEQIQTNYEVMVGGERELLSQAEADYKSPDALDTEDRTAALESYAQGQESIAADWGSRKYKDNAKVINVPHDPRSKTDQRSIGGINEGRRTRVVNQANNNAKAARKLAGDIAAGNTSAIELYENAKTKAPEILSSGAMGDATLSDAVEYAISKEVTGEGSWGKNTLGAKVAEMAAQEQASENAMTQKYTNKDTGEFDLLGSFLGDTPIQTEESFDLETQSEASLAADTEQAATAATEQAAKTKAIADRAQAEAELDSFLLTGSDAEADIAMAHGQDDLFSAAKDDETPLFSQSAILDPDAKPKGVTEAQIRARVDIFLAKYKGADDVQVWVRATQDGAFGVGSREWLDTVKAGFYPEQNAVVFIAENIDSIQDIDSTIQHELLVHKGLGLFEKEDVQGLIDVIKENAPKSETLKGIWAQVQKDYKKESIEVQAEELLAKVAEKKMSKPDKYWNKIVTFIRDMLRKIGFVKEISFSDLRKRVYDMGEAFAEGRRAETRQGFEAETKQTESPSSDGLSGSGALFSRKSKDTLRPEKPLLEGSKRPDVKAKVEKGNGKPDITIYGVTTGGQRVLVAKPRAGGWDIVVDRRASGEMFTDGKPREYTAKNRKGVEARIEMLGLELETVINKDKSPQDSVLDENHWEMPPVTWWERVRFKAQDRFLSLFRVQEEIEKYRDDELSDDVKVYEIETLYHGKTEAQLNDFQEDVLKPLVALMGKHDLSLDDVSEFLYARHAEEANTAMQESNAHRENNEALSGMSNEAAAKIMADFKSAGKLDALNQIAQITDGIIEKSRKILVKSGLEKESTVQGWREQYDHYTPLWGDPSDPEGSMKGVHDENRAGRKSKADNVLINLIVQHEKTIVRAEKNAVVRSLLKLVEQNPNPDFWSIDTPDDKKVRDPVTDLYIDKGTPPTRWADHVVGVKVDGEEHLITFNERDQHAMYIAHSLKNLGAQQVGTVVKAGLMANRYLAMINTSWNPEFVLSNFFRDIQTAFINLNDTDAADMKMRIIKNVGSSIAAIRQHQKGQRDTEAERWYDEFHKAGAQTGWLDHYDSMSSRASQIESMVRRDKHMSLDTAHRLFEYVSDVNTAVENGIRLSTYIELRKMGKSQQEAANIAKNLTVNFNRRGDSGQVVNAFYLFYNASIQGATRLAQAAKSKRARKHMAALVAFSATMDILNRLLSGEDEDGVSPYDKIPEYIKQRNMVIMLPSFGNETPERNFIKIPMPYGYNVFQVIGQVTGETLSYGFGLKDDIDAGDMAMRVTASLVHGFNPVGSDASVAQFVAPTLMDFIVQTSENKDFAGSKIRPDQMSFGPETPDSQLSWKSVPAPVKTFAELLNDMSGGDTLRPGAIDVSPETMEHAYKFVTGGAGRFYYDMVGTPANAAFGDDEVELRDIPVLRKLVGVVGDRTDIDKFYLAINDVALASRDLDRAKALHDPAEVADVRAEWGHLLRLDNRAKAVLKKVRSLSDKLAKIENSDKTDSEKELQTYETTKRIRREMFRFRSQYQSQLDSVE